MYGRRDISIIMDQSKTRFPIERELVKSTALEKIPRARTQDAYMYEGKEGAKIFHDGGRIDVLPHSLHIWCEFTPQVIESISDRRRASSSFGRSYRSTHAR